MKIDLHSIQIFGFRDIAESQIIQIPEKSILSVIGENEDNGGSNGSGKTSLIMADKVAMFGPSFVGLTSKDCKNRHLDIPSKIDVEMSVGDKKILISRTIGGKFKVFVNGDELSGKSEDIQSKLETLISIPPNHLGYLTYKAQGDYGGFIRMKDSEKKDFLGHFFNLSKFEKVGDSLKAQLSGVDTSLMTTANLINSLEAKVSMVDAQIDSLLAEINSTNISTRREEIKKNKEELGLKQGELFNLKVQIDNYQPPKPPDSLLTAMNMLNIDIENFDKKERDIYQKNMKLSSIASLLKTSKEKISALDKNLCFACGQEIHDGNTDNLRSSLEENVNALVKEYNEINQYILDQNKANTPGLKADLLSKKDLVSAEIQKFKAQNDLDSFKNSYRLLSSTVSAIQNTVRDGESYIASLETKLKAAQKTNIDLKVDSLTLSQELKSLKAERAVLEEASKTLSRSGFVGYLFDSVLEELNYESNINIQMIPNIKHLGINFSPDREIKTSGNISKEITCNISDSGNSISFNSLSGGEKRSLSIAVDEALDTILSRRLGVNVGWKFLDEPFDAIDNNSKEALLEFFKVKSSSKTYIIVDHSSEFNAALDNRIIITKRNGVATIHV